MIHAHPFRRGAFWMKVAAGLLLAALADWLFFSPGEMGGSTVGVFALAWWLAVAVVRPGLIRDRRALTAMAGAAGFALVLIDRPDFIAWLLFGLMLAIASLSARVKSGEPAWRWMQRLVVAGVVAIAGPVIDLIRMGHRRKRQRASVSPLAILKLVLLPLVGGAVFLTLFANANPLIATLLEHIQLPPLSDDLIGHAILWGLVVLMTGVTFRPRWRHRLIALPTLRKAGMPGVTGASIILSLIVFNVVFALQNGLDLAFLWSGADLPEGVTLAEYAHRGAYPLIVTALLAGLFVLIALRPGSETARKPLVRRLVVAWVAQNMLLVASSILRTAAYVEAYGLTTFRLAAMIWMVMVAIGLLLICWRMLKDRDGHWLIDANVRLVLVVLAAVSLVDLSAITASWNVRQAREIDGDGAMLDVAYLASLGSPAAVSIVSLEQSTDDDVLRDRLASVRQPIVWRMKARQSEWRTWTWRDARRLSRIEAMAAARPLIPPRPGFRILDGTLGPPPVRIQDPTVTPLTYSPGV